MQASWPALGLPRARAWSVRPTFRFWKKDCGEAKRGIKFAVLPTADFAEQLQRSRPERWHGLQNVAAARAHQVALHSAGKREEFVTEPGRASNPERLTGLEQNRVANSCGRPRDLPETQGVTRRGGMYVIPCIH